MPREIAWRILRSGTATPLRSVDRYSAQSELTPPDRALVRRLIGTEVRRRGTLHALVHTFAKGKPSRDLAAHLRLGFVQLFFMDAIPDHAAVSETVRAATDTLGTAKGRYVNAVLRTAVRARCEPSGDPRRDLVDRSIGFTQAVFRDPDAHPLLWAEDALSVPANLMKRWAKRFGREEAFGLARIFLDEPELSLRAVGIDRAELAVELAALDVEAREAEHPQVLRAPSSATERIVHCAAFEAGRIAIQGATALAAAELVGAREGERVLELCAAPGGKTAVLAGAGARVIATDINPHRLAKLRPNLARLGLAERVQCVASDGARSVGEHRFDAVLVDAPCSNTGVLGARPAARWRFGPQSQSNLRALQSELLRSCADHVVPGGRLVYSTCSLEPEENDRVVRSFVEQHAGWSVEREISALPTPRGDRGPVDGGYAARLRAPE